MKASCLKLFHIIHFVFNYILTKKVLNAGANQIWPKYEANTARVRLRI
jgi:hypothetical protein